MDETGAGRTLLEAAREAVSEAYAPYSGYRVGAALRTADGTVHTGCNVENANYSNSLHAEAVAVGRAVAAGHRNFDVLAVTSAARDGVLPCGACRQTLAEFCDEDFPVIVEAGESGGEARSEAADGDALEIRRLGELLPDAIGPADLGVDADGRR